MMSEGRRLLRASLVVVSGVELAKRIGFRKSAVSMWASGKRTPDYRGRAALLNEIGIPLDAWDRFDKFTPANLSIAIPIGDDENGDSEEGLLQRAG
jgi:transcriptional regulator with XRE-family HTH domain